MKDFSWLIRSSLDTKAMVEATGPLIGKHDFSSFCAADSGAKTRIRDILEVSIDVHGPLIDIWIVGHGFLKHMVRNIVGTLVEIGLAKRPSGSMYQIIEARDRSKAGITAPAQGLTLVKIFYGDVMSCSELIRLASRGYCMAIDTE
jgi:tRNA pseudouridine38-40 synthase